jgi:hypothetical protein
VTDATVLTGGHGVGILIIYDLRIVVCLWGKKRVTHSERGREVRIMNSSILTLSRIAQHNRQELG